VYERAKYWVAWGHEVTVITSAPNFPDGKVYPGYRNAWRTVEYMDGIRVVRVKTYMTRNARFVRRVLDFASYMLSALFFSLFEPVPDVVISTSPQLLAGVAGVIYARIRRVPHVFEIRDLWPASILVNTGLRPGVVYRLLEWLELAIYRLSTRIICVTRSFAQDLTSRGVPECKIDVVLNGGNLDLFSPRAKDAEVEKKYGLEGRFVVGYLGTQGASHGLINVLRAADLMRHDRVTFLFVGTGVEHESLQLRAREMNLSNVVFVPRQLKEEMPRFWSVCDVCLVHLRSADLFRTVIPSKIFEGMAMGLPLVYAGPLGEASNLIEELQIGIVVKPESPEQLADAVRFLYRSPLDRERFRSNSIKWAPVYSREQQAKACFAVLEKAILEYGTASLPSVGFESAEKRSTSIGGR